MSRPPLPGPEDLKWACVLVGILCWAPMALGFIFPAFLLMMMIDLHLCVRGFGNGPQYGFGTYGHLFKFMGLLFAMIPGAMLLQTLLQTDTSGGVAGIVIHALLALLFLLPFLFWAGRGLLRMLYAGVDFW
jgi:hypothetical protein